MKIFDCDDDEVLNRYIASATATLDGYTGRLSRCLISQDWKETSPEFCSCESGEGCLRFKLAPVIQVLSLEWWDGDSYEPIDPADYVLSEDQLGPRLDPVPDTTWPVPAFRNDAVRVSYTAGYGTTAAAIPQDIRDAIIQLVGHKYENREGTTRDRVNVLPYGMDEIIQRYRRWS